MMMFVAFFANILLFALFWWIVCELIYNAIRDERDRNMPRSDDGNDDEVYERHTGKKDCGCRECVKKRVWDDVKKRIGEQN